MYEKKLGGVMDNPNVFGTLRTQKKRSAASPLITVFAKYLVYLLGVVLSLLLVLLIFRFIVLAPVSDYKTNLSSVLTVPEEISSEITPAIMPKTAVYYHGVRLGEYIGEEATVSEVMAKYNITLNANDTTNYGIDDTVFYGMTIRIDEIYYDDDVSSTSIPFNSVEIPCQTIPKGERIVQREGVLGSSQKVVRNKYVNGEIVESSSEFERYIAPIDEEILVGTGGVFTAPDGTEYNYSYYIDVTATAYTHTGDPTYMGTVAEVGVIAVDPRNIALGSKVYVIGNYGDYGLCRAEDIGGGIKGKRIDVFLDTEEECVKFGRRKMRAYVIE